MTQKTTVFDPVEYLDTEEAQSEYIAAAMESGDAGHIAHAIGVVARARGIAEIAREAGVTRAALYKALNTDGDPKLSTFLGVMHALGLRLSASQAPSA